MDFSLPLASADDICKEDEQALAKCYAYFGLKPNCFPYYPLAEANGNEFKL